jgi:hypothetical protein
MFVSLDADDFFKAINSERGMALGPSVEGFVRKTDDPTIIELSPSIVSCLTWIKIPLKMIDKVQPLGKRNCVDHMHDYVIIYFKYPESAEAVVFADLLQHGATIKETTQARNIETSGTWSQYCARVFITGIQGGRLLVYHKTWDSYDQAIFDARSQASNIPAGMNPQPVVTSGGCG